MATETIMMALSSEALAYPAKAMEIRILDQASLDEANGFLRGVKGLLGKIAETFEPIIKQAHEAHRRALEEKKKHEEPLLQAERIVKAEIGRYLTEQERIRKEAEEKARREAAEAERKRLDAMQAAIEAENAGKAAEAERIFEEALAVEAVKAIVTPKVKTEGTFIRKDVKWRIIDFDAIPRDFLMVDRSKVDAVFRVQKEKTAIPGIEVYEESTVVARGN